MPAPPQVFSELPSLDLIVPALLEGGIPLARSSCALTAGIPVHPMLAKPTRGVREVLERFEGERFTCEWKYDGERAQVHLTDDGAISIFSRNSENTTAKYPDLAETLRAARAAGTTSCILDGEVVAYDPEKATLLPFQVPPTRGRGGALAATRYSCAPLLPTRRSSPSARARTSRSTASPSPLSTPPSTCSTSMGSRS